MEINDKKISVNKSNKAELKIIREFAESGDDCLVVMLNLNTYNDGAGFPNGSPYQDYTNALEGLLLSVGGRIIFRSESLGQGVGEQDIDEILAAGYPSHQAFLDLPDDLGARENSSFRKICVKSALIRRFNGVLP